MQNRSAVFVLSLACIAVGCSAPSKESQTLQRYWSLYTPGYQAPPPDSVQVVGQVLRPGVYGFRDGLSVGTVVAQAGGLSDFARKFVVRHRDDTGEYFKLIRDGTNQAMVRRYRMDRETCRTNSWPTSINAVMLREGDWIRFPPLE